MNDEMAKKGGEWFDAGYCCAESVLMAVAEANRIKSDLIPRIATGFCGGMARTRGMCGAVTGAVMGINLMKGRQEPGMSQEENYRAVRRLLVEFAGKFGSLSCWELTGCDLATEAGQKKFKDDNLHDRCRGFVEEAVRLALLS